MAPSRRIRIVATFAVLLAVASALAVPLAEQRALHAEERYVADRLANASCLIEWDTNTDVAAQRASATGLTARGLRVSVALSYAYTTETDGEKLYADAVSEATYVVSVTAVRRVDGDAGAFC